MTSRKLEILASGAAAHNDGALIIVPNSNNNTQCALLGLSWSGTFYTHNDKGPELLHLTTRLTYIPRLPTHTAQMSHYQI